MTATLLYRIAAGLLLLFAIGHTVGFLTFKPPTVEGLAVRDSMDKVQFQAPGGKRTYGDFYRGFGLFCTLYLIFLAYLSWHLGGMAQSSPQAIGLLGWAFFALNVVSVVLSWIYFIPPPVIFSALAAICTGWAAWLVKTG